MDLIEPPVALQRCDRFVARTTNWLYDYLRHVPRYRLLVLCDKLMNRAEFPMLEAWCLAPSLPRRAWRKLTGNLLWPKERIRLQRMRARVLHSHFGSQAVRDLGLHEGLGLPWVVSFYGADVYQGEKEVLQERYTRVFKRASRVLALGPKMKATLETLGCPPDRVAIQALGVNCETLPSRPRVRNREEPLRVLFAGTFREKKGLRYAIEGVGLARKAGVRLRFDIVGDETPKRGDRDTKQEVLRLIRHWGLEDIVTHYSFIRFEELLRIALQSHVFVAPSVTAQDGDSEGTPFVLQQMMATAMPVIATDHSDIPYILGDLADLLVPERDAQAIARRLQRYAEDSDALIKDGAASRNQIVRHFNVRDWATRQSALYDTARSWRLQ